MASTSQASTVPQELKRQSERITEQVQRLGTMLTTISSHLGEISTMMKDYDPNLVTQVNNLKGAIDSYKTKSANIYGDMANALLRYALSLLNNLEDLSKNISAIKSSVEAL